MLLAELLAVTTRTARAAQKLKGHHVPQVTEERQLIREIELAIVTGPIKARHAAEDEQDYVIVLRIPSTSEDGKLIYKGYGPNVLDQLSEPIQKLLKAFRNAGLPMHLEIAYSNPQEPGTDNIIGYDLIASWDYALVAQVLRFRPH